MKRTWRPDWPIDLDLVLGPLSRARNDPVARSTGAQEWWLTGRVDSGAATLQISRQDHAILGEAWGPGGQELLDRMPRMLGDGDDPTGFNPAPGTVVHRMWSRRGAHWRVPCTGLFWQTAVLAVLEQKVTGIESRAAWFRLCREHGEPALGPAPHGMWLAPDRRDLALVPSWWWRSAGVDHTRAATLGRVARLRLRGDDLADISRRLAAVRGIGPWTLAEIGCRALGDADAVSVGDFHLANLVGFALTGRPRSTDEQMLELLSPYEGHRYRAVRMIEMSGIVPPKFGPRQPLSSQRGGSAARGESATRPMKT